MPLLTRAQYAKHRGISASAIGVHVRSGALAGAMTPAGKIDAFVADEILATALTRGSHIDPKLAASKRRKLAALVALLQAKVTALESTVIPRAEAGAGLRVVSLNIAHEIYAIAPSLAASVAGQEPIVAFNALTDGIHAVLMRLSEVEITGKPGTKPRASKPATMSAVELRTLENDLYAKRYEIEQARNTGELVDVDSMGSELISRLMAMRQHLLAAPTKLAPLFLAMTPDEAQTTIVEAFADALAELACSAVGEAELRNAA